MRTGLWISLALALASVTASAAPLTPPTTATPPDPWGLALPALSRLAIDVERLVGDLGSARVDRAVLGSSFAWSDDAGRYLEVAGAAGASDVRVQLFSRAPHEVAGHAVFVRAPEAGAYRLRLSLSDAPADAAAILRALGLHAASGAPPEPGALPASAVAAAADALGTPAWSVVELDPAAATGWFVDSGALGQSLVSGWFELDAGEEGLVKSGGELDCTAPYKVYVKTMIASRVSGAYEATLGARFYKSYSWNLNTCTWTFTSVAFEAPSTDTLGLKGKGHSSDWAQSYVVIKLEDETRGVQLGAVSHSYSQVRGGSVRDNSGSYYVEFDMLGGPVTAGATASWSPPESWRGDNYKFYVFPNAGGQAGHFETCTFNLQPTSTCP